MIMYYLGGLKLLIVRNGLLFFLIIKIPIKSIEKVMKNTTETFA